MVDRDGRVAYRDFGKGRHKTGLNFWDCFAYALAKEMDERCSSRARILRARMWSAPTYHCC